MKKIEINGMDFAMHSGKNKGSSCTECPGHVRRFPEVWGGSVKVWACGRGRAGGGVTSMEVYKISHVVEEY